MPRYRTQYAKTGALRYTGNLDVHKIWERSLRRAGLPLAYSQGFHPQPRLNQACPLPLGLLSNTEVIDFWLEEDLTSEEIIEKLKPALPPGLDIKEIAAVDPRLPSLPTLVAAAEYLVSFLVPVSREKLEQEVAVFLSASEVRRELRGKTYNLRALVEVLALYGDDPSGSPQIMMRLTAREGATGRADEVISALGYDPYDTRIVRTALIFVA